MSPTKRAIHASAIVVGEGCVLVRGPSGAGKSALALALLEGARAHGLFARLVGDDRIVLDVRDGRLLARPHPAIAGLVERRGLGLARCDHEPAAKVALVVDLVEAPDRMPEPGADRIEIEGVVLRGLALRRGQSSRDQADSVIVTVREHFACQFLRDAQNDAPKKKPDRCGAAPTGPRMNGTA